MKKVMSRKEVVECATVISAHIKPIGDNLFQYEEPWSDKLIAERFGVSTTVVARLRNELHGQLASRSGGGNKNAELRAALDEALSSIRTDLAELRTKFDKLVLTLAANRIADVKHLRIVQDEKIAS